jgi:glycerophosphoryl diester phosphodiesterase
MRPFYLIGHNTNAIAEIQDGLSKGLNAFEIDINKDEDDQLYVSHDPVQTQVLLSHGFTLPPRVVPFLVELKQLAGVALVIFDCKVDDPALAAELLDDVRTHLTDDDISPRVIFSVSTIDHARSFFDRIHGRLTRGEGLMIDEEAKPGDVSRFFTAINLERACYGDGTTTIAGIGTPTPNLVSEMDAAVAFSAVANLRFVYPWVLVEANTIREFIRIGVHGVMVDVSNAPTLVNVLGEPEFASSLRAALAADDPFSPSFGLLLQVLTADVSHAGTDATVTFTIEDKNGAVFRRVVDGAFNGRFERGMATCVTFSDVLLSPQDIAAITVEHDGSGNASDWSLNSITLRRRGALDLPVGFGTLVTAGSPVRRAV